MQVQGPAPDYDDDVDDDDDDVECWKVVEYVDDDSCALLMLIANDFESAGARTSP